MGLALSGACSAHCARRPIPLESVHRLRGHGDTVVGRSVREATIRTIYTRSNAQAQNAALALSSKITALNESELEINSAENFDADRPWQNYLQRLSAKR
jgi:ribulose-5-phosphate 4-epimerase/fuculose-1-phosphate aldolase